jgi:HD superfamily phosphohydrolase
MQNNANGALSFKDKPEQIRTALYGDQWFTSEEMQVIHTRTFQRLYEIKQLGWADRIYPDAVHSRFNHCLGVLEQADRIVNWLFKNLASNNKQDSHPSHTY